MMTSARARGLDIRPSRVASRRDDRKTPTHHRARSPPPLTAPPLGRSRQVIEEFERRRAANVRAAHVRAEAEELAAWRGGLAAHHHPEKQARRRFLIHA